MNNIVQLLTLETSPLPGKFVSQKLVPAGSPAKKVNETTKSPSVVKFKKLRFNHLFWKLCKKIKVYFYPLPAVDFYSIFTVLWWFLPQVR